MKKTTKKPTATVKPKSQHDSPATPCSASFVVTQKQLATAFTEWERRYREEPDRFMSEGSKLLKETPKSYGEACAPYLLKIIAEQRA